MLRCLFVLLVLCLSITASAQSLKERKYWAQQEEEIAASAQAVMKKCDSKFTIEFDKPTFAKWTFEGNLAARKCFDVLKRIAEVCEASKEGAAGVKAKIKTVKCGAREDATPERYSIEGGVFQFTVGTDKWNYHATDWLKKNLASKNLEEAEDFARVETNLARMALDLNSKCQSNVKAEIDRPSFSARVKRTMPLYNCDRMLETLRERCDDDAKWKSLMSKMKVVRCRYLDEPESHFKELKGGVLIFGLGNGGGLDTRVHNGEIDKLLQ